MWFCGKYNRDYAACLNDSKFPCCLNIQGYSK